MYVCMYVCMYVYMRDISVIVDTRVLILRGKINLKERTTFFFFFFVIPSSSRENRVSYEKFIKYIFLIDPRPNGRLFYENK